MLLNIITSLNIQGVYMNYLSSSIQKMRTDVPHYQQTGQAYEAMLVFDWKQYILTWMDWLENKWSLKSE